MAIKCFVGIVMPAYYGVWQLRVIKKTGFNPVFSLYLVGILLKTSLLNRICAIL